MTRRFELVRRRAESARLDAALPDINEDSRPISQPFAVPFPFFGEELFLLLHFAVPTSLPFSTNTTAFSLSFGTATNSGLANLAVLGLPVSAL